MCTDYFIQYSWHRALLCLDERVPTNVDLSCTRYSHHDYIVEMLLKSPPLNSEYYDDIKIK